MCEGIVDEKRGGQNWYVVVGRMEGDSEDMAIEVQADDLDEALDAFVFDMASIRGFHGGGYESSKDYPYVFVNNVIECGARRPRIDYSERTLQVRLPEAPPVAEDLLGEDSECTDGTSVTHQTETEGSVSVIAQRLGKLKADLAKVRDDLRELTDDADNLLDSSEEALDRMEEAADCLSRCAITRRYEVKEDE